MITAAGLRTSVRAALAETRGRRDAFVAGVGAGSAAVAAFDEIRQPLDEAQARCSLYASVHPAAEVRRAAEELERELADLDAELALDRGVYEVLAGVDAASLVEADTARLLARALRDFRREGVDRDEATRARVRELRRELVDLGQEFDRNIIQGGRRLAIEEGHAALGGLPDDWVAARPAAADGSVTLSTDPPDYRPFMLYAERADLRERFLVAMRNRAVPENLDVLPRLLARRGELARLLGHESWAAYVTEDKMARTPATVRAFLDEVHALARPHAEEEYAALLAEKRELEPGAEVVRESERLYLLERVKRSRLGFDSREVRPYFVLERVKTGVLDLAARLFGLAFVPVRDEATWHADVETFAVHEDGREIARFHLDLTPRDGKFKHAGQFLVRTGIAGRALPEAALVCNFPRPTGGEPGLLLHSDVTTFFHEFGHLLHQLLGGRQRYLAFSGIATEWDFVEVPSQLFEEWAWDARVLRTFATHVETGAPIPAELVERLRAAEEYGKGLRVEQQVSFARMSLELHAADPTDLDVARVVRDLGAATTRFPFGEGTHFEAAFVHLNGYSALYYTYLWSLVIAKDLRGAFGDDLFDSGLAGRFREEVLAPGGSRDAADMIRSFLGREHELAAWEAWLGA